MTKTPSTDYQNYTENNYGRVARLTTPNYRKELVSWQVPAIKQHFGTLDGKVFIDIGAGDIVLGDMLAEIGRPSTFYAQDLSRPSLQSGIKRIKDAGEDVTTLVPLASDHFDFSTIPDGTVDCAFSNSLFSHLSYNSIILCLRNLHKKMKPGAKYMSSMIVVPDSTEPYQYDWSGLGTRAARVISYINKDPFHYSEVSIKKLEAFETGFEMIKVHEYGHAFQKLVEFRAK